MSTVEDGDGFEFRMARVEMGNNLVAVVLVAVGESTKSAVGTMAAGTQVLGHTSARVARRREAHAPDKRDQAWARHGSSGAANDGMSAPLVVEVVAEAVLERLA